MDCLDDPPNSSDSGCSDLHEIDDSNDSSDDDMTTDTSCSSTLAFPNATTDCPNPDVQHVMDLMSEDGWNFRSIASSARVFEDKIILQNETMYQPQLRWSRKGKQPSWELNYTVVSFLMNGQYYSDYESIIGMMGLPIMAQSRWNKMISVIGKQVHSLAIRSCQQVQENIIA